MTQAQSSDPQPASPKPRKRRRWLRRLGWFCIIYILVSIALSFIPEGQLDVKVIDRQTARLSGWVRAGTGKACITPPKELWAKMNLYDEKGPIAGVADDLYVRALMLSASGSNNTAVSLVSVELLVIPPTLEPAVRAELSRRGLGDVKLTLAATHTHAGPGNFWDVPFGRFYMGNYSDEYFKFLVGRVADAVQQSQIMYPARIGFASVPTRHLVLQRRVWEPQTGLPAPVDETMEVIRIDATKASDFVATSDGRGPVVPLNGPWEPIAYVMNLGAHPTSLVHQTHKTISGEFPGAISRQLEAAHPGTVALFVQGAEGSVRSASPRPYDGYKGIDQPKFAKVAMQADMLAYYVAQAEKLMKNDEGIDVAWESVKVKLPGADAHFFPEERPWLAARVLTIIPNWIFNRVADWVFVPGETTFQAMRINHTYVFTFPCDLSNSLGWQLKRMVRREHVLVMPLANDYSMGYVLSREEYDMGGILKGVSERGQDYFGKRAGPFCIKVAHMLAQDIKEEGAEDPFTYDFGDHPSMMPDGTKLAPAAGKTPTEE